VATQAPPPKKFTQRAKRFAVSAGLGTALGLGCSLLPEHWRLPCATAVKLLALFFGAS
jgi:hypothetical protein